MTKASLPISLSLAMLLTGCGGEQGDTSAQGNTLADAAPVCGQTIEEIAAGFIPLFYEQGAVREAYETYVHKDYIQHNPGAENGRDAAINFLEPIFQNNPQHKMTVHKMTVHKIIVEDPYIVVHLHGQSTPDDLGAAAVDILRVEDCLIVEHWDVTQAVPAETTNGNGMF